MTVSRVVSLVLLTGLVSLGCGTAGEAGRADVADTGIADDTPRVEETDIDDATGVEETTGDDAARAEETSRGDVTSAEETESGGEFCPVVGYEPCGGELVGTWAFRAVCPDDPVAAAAVCKHPFDDQQVCTGAGNEALCDGTHSGTLAFHADGTVDIDTQVSLVVTWHFSDECMEAVVDEGATPEERCGSLDTMENQSCSYNVQCICVAEPLIEGSTATAEYAIAGQDLVIGDDPPSTWCVDGDILTMDFYAYHPDSWRYWILERE